MKNLANCKPTEFLVQTNKIRKSVENWLTVTDVMNIRKRMPQNMPEVNSEMSKDDARAILDKRHEMIAEQSLRNLSAMFDAALEDHPAETLEVLALCCFVEPENVDDHSMSEYFGAMNDLIRDQNVRDFFTLLASLVQ